MVGIMRLSVALCTYNGEQYLAEQLDSLAAQTRPPDELVACDDHSTDRTPDIIRDFAARAPFPVHLHVNPDNVGSTRNFDRAVRLCRGEVIALCDQDDVWHPLKLGRFEEVFSTDPSVGLVFTDAEVVDESLRPTGARLWDATFDPEERRLMKEGRAFDVLAQHNVVTGATMAFRSRLRDVALPIPDSDAFIHDGWIALTVAAVSRVEALAEPLVKYRQHAGQQIGVGAAGAARDGTPAARARYYAGEAEKLERLRERLLAARGLDDGSLDSRVKRAGELAAHYRVRGGLLKTRRERLPLVLRELLTLRYHRYSKGLSSAALDLLR
ncbi:MAG TPA: glycosyltransferase family 2 protein [Pyrinomonadaceae bacterium]|jgi:glycosyltransferase involved in cell wall biosynthesis|nr:glycosyltransferase family 2 protein [Pyrinomonadaceae bacterium]